MKLEPCMKCDAGIPVHNAESNRFSCNTCDNTAPNSYGGSIDDAAHAWNDCNTPSRTIEEVLAENENLKADIYKILIEAGDVLKNHTAMMAQIDSLHHALMDAKNALLHQDSRPEFIEQLEHKLSQTPEQSLNIIEAGAIRKAAHKLCVGLTGKKLTSHTALINYAEELENLND